MFTTKRPVSPARSWTQLRGCQPLYRRHLAWSLRLAGITLNRYAQFFENRGTGTEIE